MSWDQPGATCCCVLVLLTVAMHRVFGTARRNAHTCQPSAVLHRSSLCSLPEASQVRLRSLVCVCVLCLCTCTKHQPSFVTGARCAFPSSPYGSRLVFAGAKVLSACGFGGGLVSTRHAGLHQRSETVSGTPAHTAASL
eukprot:scpid33314/ scgid7109/ 